MFRKGLVEALRADVALRVVAEAGDGQAALELIEKRRPSLAVLDIEMPKLSGLDVAQEVGRRGLPVQLVILTMHDDAATFDRAIELGVGGYVLKDNAVNDIVTCVHYVASGRTYVSPGLSRHLVGRGRAARAPAAPPGVERLTPVERRVLGLVAGHLTTRAIAAQLGASPKTVENHRSNICRKLGISGTNALLRFALEHRRLLEPR
jgi:DNA-binding NarL/FixJ family response regulator